jgi:membrane-associated phospholipid phosphatase
MTTTLSTGDSAQATDTIGSRQPAVAQRCLTPILVVALVSLFASVVVATFGRESLDHPVALFLNRFANRSELFDRAVGTLIGSDLANGVVLMAGIWLAWFDAPELEARAKLAAGIIAASLSGLVSRALQIGLPTHPRPIHDGTLPLTHFHTVNTDTVNLWNSFPSDHASLLFALAMVITLIRPGIGFVAFVWVVIIDLGRVYIGIHYLSDIIGGAGLGVASVCLSQHPAIYRRCLAFGRWARERAGVFYAAAFLLTHSMATLFDSVRSVAQGLAAIFR